MYRLLDLFCGAGGVAAGYDAAGFDVTGVDLALQPRYPLWQLVQGDAIAVLDDVDYCREFDVIHASPPCQSYSKAMKHLSGDYPRLIEPVRDRLTAIGRPFIIENVIGAPLRDPVMICGTGLGLRVYRHRIFESNVRRLVGTVCHHDRPALNPHDQAGRDRIYREQGRRGDPEPVWRDDMGVGWMHRYEAREAIPPAYTEYLGRQLIAHLDRGQTSTTSPHTSQR